MKLTGWVKPTTATVAVVVLAVVEDASAPETELREFLSQDGLTGGSIRQDGSGAVVSLRV